MLYKFLCNFTIHLFNELSVIEVINTLGKYLLNCIFGAHPSIYLIIYLTINQVNY